MPWEVRQNGDKWCVYKKGASTPIKGGCHSAIQEARKHQKALYANNAMSEEGGAIVNSFLAFAENAKLDSSDGLVWVEALPAKVWFDPRYGDTPIDDNKLQNFVRNFNENVRGQEISTDFEHGADPSKGRKASGTYRKLEIRPRDDGVNSLWAGVELTPTAFEEVKNKEWKYFSLEWEDEWTHPETKTKHEDVIIGGALTNRPVAKGLAPINFSEVLEVLDESAAEEHQEPGTGFIDPDINPDDAAETGSRREDDKESDNVADPNEGSNIQNKGGNGEGGEIELTPEQIQELREITGIDEHGDIVATVKAMSEELEPLRELRKQAEAKKKFAEEYPDEAERLALLEKDSQENSAKKFSESFETRRIVNKTGEGDDIKDEPTSLGFSALVLEEIQKCAKQFAEGKPEFDTFKGVLDAIMDNGVVDYGTRGSDKGNDHIEEAVVVAGTTSARKAFAEKVEEIQKKDELSFEDALTEAAKQHPKLAEAWREPNVTSAA